MKYNMNISPVDDCVWLNEDCTLLIDGDTPEEAANAAQALNDSCRLSEENAKLREIIWEIVDDCEEECYNGLSGVVNSKTIEKINQLKEQNNDK